MRRQLTGQAWTPPGQAKPVQVLVPRAPTARATTSWRTALILPDPQFGYHRHADGGLDPFHDPHALDLARQLATLLRPDLTIWLGDVLDLPQLSRFRHWPSALAWTLQATIDRAHQELAVHASLARHSVMLAGNHDERLHNAIADNLAAAVGLRRAGTDGLPDLTVPALLGLDRLGVEYVGAWPAGAHYINDHLAVVHGRLTGRNALERLLDLERVSVITGHLHRIGLVYRTRNTRGRPVVSVAHCPGTLARIDGAVPSRRSGVDVWGRPVRAWEDWQQGVTVVRFEPHDGRFVLIPVPFLPGPEHPRRLWCWWADRLLTSQAEEDAL